MTFIHPYSTEQSTFTALKILCALPIHPSPRLVPGTHGSVYIVLPFPAFHVFGTLEYIAFSDALFSLSNMHLSFPMSFHGSVSHF
jgi:hypothetical protein